MKSRTFLVMPLVVAALLACQVFTAPLAGAPAPAVRTSAPAGAKPPAGGTTPAKGAAPSHAKDYQYIFGAPSHPLKVTAALDVARQVTATISLTSGGQLQTTGADGTVFALAVPRAAVASDTVITLTPASKLSGLPFDGKAVYAAEVQPEGLFLYADATLTITPTQALPPAQQLFFDYQAGGKTVGLAIPVAGAKALSLRLMHFSGYGVAAGTPADSAAVVQQLGGDPMAALQSLTAQALTQLNQDAVSGNQAADAEAVQTVLDLIDQYEETVVKPSLEAAQTSCAAGKQALHDVLALERQRQLLGLGSSASFQNLDLGALITGGSLQCVKEAYQRCTDEHVINGMIPLYVDMLAQHQTEVDIAGKDVPEPPELVQARELTVKCLTFELQFHSQGAFDTGDGGYTSTVDGKIALHFDPTTFAISGSGPLDNLTFEFKMPKGGKGSKCTATNTTGGGTFEVKALAYVEDTRSETDPNWYVRDYKLLYFPGVTSESYKIHCTLTDSQGHVTVEDYASPPSGFWSAIFFVVHQEELNGAGAAAAGGPPAMPPLDLNALALGALPPMPAPAMPAEGGFFADQWDITSGDALLASKEWIRSNASVHLTETGTLKIVHKPGG
jgi:hypothetical protein